MVLLSSEIGNIINTNASKILCLQKEAVKTACANGLDIQLLPGYP